MSSTFRVSIEEDIEGAAVRFCFAELPDAVYAENSEPGWPIESAMTCGVEEENFSLDDLTGCDEDFGLEGFCVLGGAGEIGSEIEGTTDTGVEATIGSCTTSGS